MRPIWPQLWLQLLGREGSPGDYHIGFEQPHKWIRYHILTQNLKALDIGILLLICCSTFTFPFNVRLLTRT
jgi:hypothetical protein